MLFKTNWLSSDYFNADDYNRIKSNIEDLLEIALKYYRDFSLYSIDEVTVNTIPTYATLNAIEDNVELIADNTFRPDDLAAGKHYTAKGGTAWDYADLNRIENNLKLLYEGFVDIFGGLKILKFELGGGLFG